MKLLIIRVRILRAILLLLYCVIIPFFADIPNQNEKFPVMLFIHGGGFQFGSGNHDLHGPDFIIDENVILVNMRNALKAFICHVYVNVCIIYTVQYKMMWDIV